MSLQAKGEERGERSRGNASPGPTPQHSPASRAECHPAPAPSFQELQQIFVWVFFFFLSHRGNLSLLVGDLLWAERKENLVRGWRMMPSVLAVIYPANYLPSQPLMQLRTRHPAPRPCSPRLPSCTHHFFSALLLQQSRCLPPPLAGVFSTSLGWFFFKLFLSPSNFVPFFFALFSSSAFQTENFQLGVGMAKV